MAELTASMTKPQQQEPKQRFDFLEHSNTYNIFILILTILSLALMVVQFLLPEDSETWTLVNFYNNLTCIIFLIDFALHMIREPHPKDYFIGKRGYLDLLGSIPSFGYSRYTALLRLFRISRLFRLRRLLNPENRKLLIDEVLHNRGSYALFFTLMMIAIVVTVASITVLFYESQSPNANITTGGDAVWWTFVTITTVGYGDKYPVTGGGRTTAVFVMFAGVGVIGALASILASILVPQPEKSPAPDPASEVRTVEEELSDVKKELAALRALLEKQSNS
jgi:voltage-gated potassium channel